MLPSLAGQVKDVTYRGIQELLAKPEGRTELKRMIEEAEKAAAWPDPTPEMLNGDPLFDAIWERIKSWDINVPSAYSGYCGATGNHARAIYDVVKAAAQREYGKAAGKKDDRIRAESLDSEGHPELFVIQINQVRDVFPKTFIPGILYALSTLEEK